MHRTTSLCKATDHFTDTAAILKSIVSNSYYGILRADLHDTILSHGTSSRQAYDMTYDCRSVLKHVLKCYDIFF